MASNNAREQPPQGLVSGHVQYIRGATTETIGKMSGSESWKTSGEQNKADAVRAMQKATEKRDPNRDGYGKVEEMVGNLTGCEGMQKEGAASKRE
ncbi:hypothetical protein ESCO_002059 [Escovopsis weberi]|uniref:CsbD-like domain-containing protein n=1 Tax=Escovopsis weberi TaxID=150374 RepID=A0A0M8N2M1_ESCWE|nr:hypothetical protein ESCO_002059 [Escovopsis weberi]